MIVSGAAAGVGLPASVQHTPGGGQMGGGATVAATGATSADSAAGDSTSTVTNANGSVTTTVTGPNGAVLSSSTTGGKAASQGREPSATRGAGSAQSAGVVDLSV